MATNQYRVAKVKIIGHWASSRDIIDEWKKMIPSVKLQKKFIENTDQSRENKNKNKIIVLPTVYNNADVFLVINSPFPGEYYNPERTIVLQMEPNMYFNNELWGVWHDPQPHMCVRVRRHAECVNMLQWHLKMSFDELFNNEREIVKTKGDTVSVILSNKYVDEGHIARTDLAHMIEADPRFSIDVYGTNTSFKNYKGTLPAGEKDEGLVGYKYHINMENNFIHNYVTEKLVDCILCETLCFYAGPPNICSIINPRAFVLLDPYDLKKSLETVHEYVRTGEWEKRISIIRGEKARILEEIGFYHQIAEEIDRVLFD